MLFIKGKWQMRIIILLREAHYPLTTRQLRIRCGMLHDKSGSLMRNTLRNMVQLGMLDSVKPGLFKLP